ncbi:hypothetical protein EJF18_60038 [Clavispora lusitaniae]|uniref:Uncharacterized protein n=1 Tax=Clavispora lusitaniae TaxID=36911 RepID=A0ACD0WQX5_CLALS|nr:hypothetical protein EJF14_60038 [Clavispora lusitaniae]QFZ35178.1 hypothetical protein EJF16_60038 [Clavispora lusitaniae]QFZ40872.1 hypothetical protein EJF15_60038 [Clavispora lusitaniae]QFZ46553.1 hypothetical protein EJF18_60038 [Clavispora lusitaniae]QFZ52218.1 hypothetical protein EJF17_60038 [Clavispora lusitaniae]
MQRTVSVCTLGSFHLASPMYFFFYVQMQHQWSYSSAYQESLPPPVFLPIRAVQRRKRKDSKDSSDSCFVPYVRGRPPEPMSHDFGPALPFTRHPATAHIAKYQSKRHNPSNHGLCNHYGGVLVD